VPGGLEAVAAIEDTQTLDWVRRIGGDATWVTSVCTEALVRAAAGLLARYKGACHWASWHKLAWFRAEPVADRTVFDRNRVTGGGMTAGTDFALALTAVIRGEDRAKFVQLSIEYDLSPPFNSDSPEKADATTIARYRAMVAKLARDREP
jgi:cyclohexyl-isocyanide hydratase